ncbi:MAG: hypothetical protein PVSMB7_30280 [Chloroflexota bacterium]
MATVQVPETIKYEDSGERKPGQHEEDASVSRCPTEGTKGLLGIEPMPASTNRRDSVLLLLMAGL